jgi:hypothetical protein
VLSLGRPICRYSSTDLVLRTAREREGRAPAGTKNTESWNYFRMYSLLKVTINISDGMASNGSIINEC